MREVLQLKNRIAETYDKEFVTMIEDIGGKPFEEYLLLEARSNMSKAEYTEFVLMNGVRIKGISNTVRPGSPPLLYILSLNEDGSQDLTEVNPQFVVAKIRHFK